MNLPEWIKNAASVCKRYGTIAVPLVGIAAYEGYSYYSASKTSPPPVAIIGTSEFLNDVEAGKITTATMNFNDGGYAIQGTFKDKTLFETWVPSEATESLVKELRKQNVDFSKGGSSSGWTFGRILSYGFDLALIFMVLGGPRKLAELGITGGKSKLMEKDTGVTFNDVAGIDEAKGELQEVVDFLKNPTRYTKIGAKLPKGVLLSGPPGTGKTLLARAVAGEAGVPFFSISGSDFVEMYVGVGAARVRGMFKQANKKAPCIIFIDELDAIGGSREDRDGGGGDDEYNQTLNQLLVGMDGISANKSIIIIGATNLPGNLDRALLRPGRFDRKVIVPLPDANGREEILKIHAQKLLLNENVKLSIIAGNTPGFSGADLANLVNEAALSAARQDKNMVDMADFEHAKDRLVLGLARRSMVLSDAERKLTAYHEAGHALVAIHQDGCRDLDKVTIIPHGEAMGVTVSNAEDQRSLTFRQCSAQLVHLYGGREAERLIYGDNEITTGAASDIKVATSLARRMIEEFGMSKLGQVDLQGDISEETAREIELAIREKIRESSDSAYKLLDDHKDELTAIAEALLSRDTLSGAEIRAIATTALIS